MEIISNNKTATNTVEVEFKASAEEFEQAVQAAYLKKKKNINVPGFRKGKAPRKIIDEAIYNGMMSQPFLYTPWRKEHKDLAAIKVGDLVLTPGINMKAIQHFYDAIRKAFFKSEEYNWRWYKFRNRSEYVTYLRKHEEAE